MQSRYHMSLHSTPEVNRTLNCVHPAPMDSLVRIIKEHGYTDEMLETGEIHDAALPTETSSQDAFTPSVRPSPTSQRNQLHHYSTQARRRTHRQSRQIIYWTVNHRRRRNLGRDRHGDNVDLECQVIVDLDLLFVCAFGCARGDV